LDFFEMKSSKTYFAALALVIAFVLPANAQDSTPIDSIVAVVNDDVILRSELDQSILTIVSRMRAEGRSLPPMDLIEKQVLENLITSKLEIQRAMETGIRVSDSDVDNALMTVAQQNQLSVTELRRAIEADGFDFAEFRRSLAEDIVSSRLRQRISESMVTVTETEVDILLSSEDLVGGEFDLSHIMIGLPEGATPQQIAAAEDEASDVYNRLLEGLDFGAAAISYSDAPEALEGGDIGWRDLNTIPRNLADAIENLPVGSFTQPVRSTAGYHILKLNDKRESAVVMVREYHARHIMLIPSEVMNARQAMDRITEVSEKIKAGEDFAELAREYSDDQTSANLGGDLGWFQAGRYGERMQQTIAALEVDEVSEPFQTEIGWHIVQYLGEREMDRTEEAIRGDARNKIFQRKADAELQKFLRQMRDEAYVENRLTG
jgi:peptidyl-prolyl cis-trans isomerase SurA